MRICVRAERADDERKPKREPGQEASEVVAGSGEDGVDGITGAVGEVIAAHAMLGLQVSDDGLDRGAPPHPAFDLRRHAPFLSGGVDADIVRRRRAMSAIAGIGDDAHHLCAGRRLDGGDHGCERMAVVRIARQRLGVENELAAA